MDRVLDFIRGRSAALAGEADRPLLDRFLMERDEGAFAELVRRYGPVVWGVCRRRLARPQDAEDAFQATFLVLARRAGRLDGRTPLGPWLHRVAELTARNVVRGNRRRDAVSGPMEREVPARGAGPPLERLDLDAALLGLPERERAAVVLCHLLGLSRRDAAARLGCPEGTLSARLNRAMAHLRARLGVGAPAAVASAGATAVPAELAAATARMAAVYAISFSTPAGPSPAVAGLTCGVLRMLWVKKLTVAAMTVMMLVGGGVLVGGGLLAFGTPTGPDAVGRAAEPAAGGQPAPPANPDDAARRLDQRLAELEEQKAALDRALIETAAERAKVAQAKKDKDAAADLGASIALVVTEGGKGVGWGKPPYTVREVVGGKVGEMQCYELDILGTYLTRAFNDPKGPKRLRIYADQHFSHDQILKVCAVCAGAGFKTARFILPEAPLIASDVDWKTGKVGKVERGEKEKDLDLTTYVRPRNP